MTAAPSMPPTSGPGRRRGRRQWIPLALVALIVAGSFLLPSLAGAALTVGCGVAGVQAESLQVTVDAWPPQEIAVGHADRVRMSAKRLVYGEMTAGAVEISIRDPDIPGGTSGPLDASITSATVGQIPISSIEAHGPNLESVAFTMRLGPLALLELAGRVLAGEIDLLRIPGPDQLRIALGPRAIAVRFHVTETTAGLDGLTIRGTATVSIT